MSTFIAILASFAIGAIASGIYVYVKYSKLSSIIEADKQKIIAERDEIVARLRKDVEILTSKL